MGSMWCQQYFLEMASKWVLDLFKRFAHSAGAGYWNAGQWHQTKVAKCLLVCLLVCLFVRLLVCLIVCLIVSLIVCLIVWLFDWLFVWLLDSLSDWLFDWLLDCLIDCLTDWVYDRLFGWLCEWVFYWLIAWLIVWLIDCLIDWLIIEKRAGLLKTVLEWIENRAKMEPKSTQNEALSGLGRPLDTLWLKNAIPWNSSKLPRRFWGSFWEQFFVKNGSRHVFVGSFFGDCFLVQLFLDF